MLDHNETSVDMLTIIRVPDLKILRNDYRIDLETCYAILRCTVAFPRDINTNIEDENIEELETTMQAITDTKRLEVCIITTFTILTIVAMSKPVGPINSTISTRKSIRFIFPVSSYEYLQPFLVFGFV